MIRTFFVEIVLPVLLFLLARMLLQNLFGSLRSVTRQQRPPKQESPMQASELKKDPVCGTYVSTAASVTRTVNGKVVYFCSVECRDKYRVA